MDKRKIYTKIVFFSLLLIATAGCNDDDDSPNERPSARISGQVRLFDEGTDSESNAGMTVSVDGLIFEDLTDSEGRFELNEIPLGPLVLVYEKSGYGMFKQFVDDFSDDLVLDEVPELGRKSQTDVITNSVVSEGMEVRISSVTTGTNTPSRYLRYFFGTGIDVSSENYDAFLERPIESDPGTNPAIFAITSQELNDLGFASGTTVYVQIYGDSFHSNDYDDPDLGRRVFPNLFLDAAQSVQFQVP